MRKFSKRIAVFLFSILGWYGEQPGDNPAQIGRLEQQSIIIETTVSVLQQVTESGRQQ
jgi:hypothetical protein